MLTTDERGLLEQLTEDAFPLLVLAPSDPEQRAEVQQTAISLLRRGLIEIYGHDASTVPPTKAGAILSAPESWNLDNPTAAIWFICASPAGNAFLLTDR